MTAEQFANNASSTLNGGIGPSNTTLVVTSATPFPTSPQFRLLLGSTGTGEIVLVTAVAGTTFTITRAQESTTAQTWVDLSAVTHILTAAAVSTIRTLGGDASGTTDNITVTKLQNRSVNSVAPTDGYVLTWDQTDGYWYPKAVTTTSLQFAQTHDTTYSPIALYQFNGDLTDSSGNGRTLTLDAGTTRFADISPHLKGFAFDGSTRLKSTDTTFNTTGDITIEMLVRIQTTGSDRVLVSCMDTGETLASNYLYAIYQINTGLFFESFWEFSTGTNVSYDNTTGSYEVADIFHLAMVRQSNVITFYVNGKISGAASGTLTAPATTAGTQKFFVGGNLTDNSFVGIISSLKILTTALTAAQIESEFELTLGNIFNKGLLNSSTTNISGNPVSVQTMGSSQDGYVLTWDNSNTYWIGKAPLTGVTWSATQTSAYQILPNDVAIPIDTTSGAVYVTLPAAPFNGERHTIADVGGVADTNNIIVSANGKTINGLSTYTVIGKYNVLELTYHSGKGVWIIT